MLVQDHEALIAEAAKESVLNDNYVNCFDPFKDFYGEEVENVRMIDEVEEETNTGKVADSLTEEVADYGLTEEGKNGGKVAKMVIDMGKNQEEDVLSGLVCDELTGKKEKVTVNVGKA
ncbi:hypothetical protein QVD17_38218 [Tagetes erecta]|uniref:Uncharacterized protein n=1 Tax=Tagetes erecta TaxID=13708 RepID=A0AAD8NKI0_TARER|nr:hypothetical protein QVD17_38218 [Tagetes erecta]